MHRCTGRYPWFAVRERTPIMRVKGLTIRHCLGIAAVALVAACGGGTEDGAGGAGTGGQAVTLSVQNEPTLSAAAVREFISAQAIASRGTGTSPGQLNIAGRPVQRAMAAVRQPGRVTAQAAAPFDDPCSGGGSVTLEVADDLLSFKATFNACAEDGEITNGSINLVLASLSDDTLQQTFDVKATGLSVTQGNNATVKLTGDLRMTLDTRTAGQTTASLTSATQSFEQSFNGLVQASSTLRDLQMVHVVADSGQLTDTFSFNSDGTVAALGAVAFKAESVTALVTPAGAGVPGSGQIKVTVNGKGVILLTAEATRLHVQGDVDGDGKFEIDRFDTWNNLSGGL